MKNNGIKECFHCPSNRKEVLSDSPELTELTKNILNKGTNVRIQVTGFSMSPFIRSGDVVTICPEQNAGFTKGEVVACVHPGTGRLIIHRVVQFRSDGVLIKGDNTLEADGWIAKSDILGVVKQVERDGKPIWLGLGPERRLIAFVTRKGLHVSLMLPLWKRVRSRIKKLLQVCNDLHT